MHDRENEKESDSTDDSRAEQGVDFTFEDIDFGLADSELVSAFEPSRKTTRQIRMDELFDETVVLDENSVEEQTTVLKSPLPTSPHSPNDKKTTAQGQSARIANEYAEVLIQNAANETSIERGTTQLPSDMANRTGSSEKIDPPTTVLPEPASEQLSDGNTKSDRDDIAVKRIPKADESREGDEASSLEHIVASGTESDAKATSKSKVKARKRLLIPVLIGIAAAAAIALVIAFVAIPASAPPEEYLLTIQYVDDLTGEAVAEPSEAWYTEGDFPENVQPIDIDGFVAVSADGGDNGSIEISSADTDGKTGASVPVSPGPLGGDGRVITFYYAKLTGYTVRYLESGTDAVLSTEKKVDGELTKTSITEKAIDIENYELAGQAEQTIELSSSSESNLITFYYSKKTEEAPVEAVEAVATDQASNQSTYTSEQTATSEPAATVTPPAPSTPSAPTDDELDGNWGNSQNNNDETLDGTWGK